MNPLPSSDVGAIAKEAAEVVSTPTSAASISPTTPNTPAVMPAAEDPFLALTHADMAKRSFILATILLSSSRSRLLQALGFCFMVPAQDSDDETFDLNLPPPELIRKIKSRCLTQFTDDYVIWFLGEHGSPEESAEYAKMKSSFTEAQKVSMPDSIGVSNMLFLSQRGKLEHALEHVDQVLIEALNYLEDILPTPQEQVKAPNQNDAAAAAVPDQKLPDCVVVDDDETLLDGDDKASRQHQKRKAVDDDDLQVMNKKAAHGGNPGIVAYEAEAALED